MVERIWSVIALKVQEAVHRNRPAYHENRRLFSAIQALQEAWSDDRYQECRVCETLSEASTPALFAQTKHNRRISQFQRRGRSAARSEWRLITATHNLLKLHKHQLALQAA